MKYKNFSVQLKNVKDSEGFLRIDGLMLINNEWKVISPEALDEETVYKDFDKFISDNNLDKTSILIDNDYIFWVKDNNPEIFDPARPDLDIYAITGYINSVLFQHQKSWWDLNNEDLGLG